MAINHKINQGTDEDLSGTVIVYNCGSCLKFHFVISPFRYFAISLFRHFAVSCLNTPKNTSVIKQKTAGGFDMKDFSPLKKALQLNWVKRLRSIADAAWRY